MWDERYAGAEYAYGTEPNAFLVEAAPALPPAGRVLCLAEGEGRNAVWLAGQGHVVTGVDASRVGLDKARRLAEARGVKIAAVHADLATFDLGLAAWDGIVSIFCHLPPALRRQVHAGVVDALRPGGVLVLEAYTPHQLAYGSGGPPVAEMMMSLSILEDELHGLDFLLARECVREVHEGQFHTGTGAVVQVVARKP